MLLEIFPDLEIQGVDYMDMKLLTNEDVDDIDLFLLEEGEVAQ